ncbi:MAG: hypothetical protein GX650_08385 [Clostridiales bacterium]|jgi:cardiolipin synthase|nr:hypothetical protein [Clostridiales bacterium]
MREGSNRIWTAPNALTMLRLLLIPVYWVLMMTKGNEKLALVVFLVASVTDLIDGWIARRFNQITNFGKLFDPLADKLMVLSVMLSLVLKGMLPALPLIVLLLKEALMIYGGVLMLRHQVVVYAKPIGKIAQLVIVCALILSFFGDHFTAFPVHLIVLGVGIALTLGALFYYAHACLTAIRAEKQAELTKQEEK